MLNAMGKVKRAWLAYDLGQFVAGLLLWSGIAALAPSGTLGIVSAGALIKGLGPPALSPWLLLVLLALASWAAVLFKFEMDTGYFISFDVSFALVALMLVSPLAGAALALLMVGVDCLNRLRKPGVSRPDLGVLMVGNAGNRLLRFGLAWLAYSALGGRLPPSGCLEEAGAWLGAFAVFYSANILLFAPSESLRGEDMRAFWRGALRQDFGFTFSVCAVAYLMALSAVKLGLLALLLMGAFVILASRTLSLLTSAQRQLKGRVEDLTILSKVSAAANSGLDVMPMVESFTRAMAESLPVDGIGVIFYQRYAPTLHLVQVEGVKSRSTYLPEEKKFQYEQLPLSEPSQKLGERLFEFLQPLETAPFVIPPSVFGLPLLHGGEPFGGIVAYSYKEGVELAGKQWLLETCAQSLVVALENCFLHLQAIQDPLTGLFNRSYFLYRLEEELSYASRHRAPFGLIMLDLDDFKAVNDHLGHEAGDKVLQRIGDLLRRNLRREDVPARYGGDEFILLLLSCSEKDALEKAEKVRAVIAGRSLPKEEAVGLSIGCSVGFIHSTRLRGEQDVPNLLRRLDQALYKAKAAGKNRVVVAE
jgi:diguanylate cyclase (GGDEF)-like protein